MNPKENYPMEGNRSKNSEIRYVRRGDIDVPEVFLAPKCDDIQISHTRYSVLGPIKSEKCESQTLRSAKITESDDSVQTKEAEVKLAPSLQRSILRKRCKEQTHTLRSPDDTFQSRKTVLPQAGEGIMSNSNRLSNDEGKSHIDLMDGMISDSSMHLTKIPSPPSAARSQGPPSDTSIKRYRHRQNHLHQQRSTEEPLSNACERPLDTPSGIYPHPPQSPRPKSRKYEENGVNQVFINGRLRKIEFPCTPPIKNRQKNPELCHSPYELKERPFSTDKNDERSNDMTTMEAQRILTQQKRVEMSYTHQKSWHELRKHTTKNGEQPFGIDEDDFVTPHSTRDYTRSHRASMESFQCDESYQNNISLEDLHRENVKMYNSLNETDENPHAQFEEIRREKFSVKQTYTFASHESSRGNTFERAVTTRNTPRTKEVGYLINSIERKKNKPSAASTLPIIEHNSPFLCSRDANDDRKLAYYKNPMSSNDDCLPLKHLNNGKDSSIPVCSDSEYLRVKRKTRRKRRHASRIPRWEQFLKQEVEDDTESMTGCASKIPRRIPGYIWDASSYSGSSRGSSVYEKPKTPYESEIGKLDKQKKYDFNEYEPDTATTEEVTRVPSPFVKATYWWRNRTRNPAGIP